ncbi:MAG: hypothetical protein Aurels2KO_26140 [Aureliella sp.]
MTLIFDIDRIDSRRIGRSRILDALEEATASHDGVTLVVVEGESGVGKSHLLSHLDCQVDDVASSKYTNELDIRTGFVAALEDLLLQKIDRGVSEVQESVRTALRGSLHIVETYFRKLLPFSPRTQTERKAYTTLEATQRFHTLVSELTDIAFSCSSNFVTLDDLQWAASSSLHLFHSVIRRHLASTKSWNGSVIAFTARTQRAPKQDAWIDSSTSQLPVYRVHLHNLSYEDVLACTNLEFASRVDQRNFCDAVLRITDGNPLRMNRYAHWLERTEAIDDDLRLRSMKKANLDSWTDLQGALEDLTAGPASHVVDVGACFVGRFHRSEIAHITASTFRRDSEPALSTSDAEKAIDTAIEDGWLSRFADEQLSFSHDQLREQVRSRLRPDKRKEVQLKIGLDRLNSRLDTSGLLYLQDSLTEIPAHQLENVARAFTRGAEYANTANSPSLALRYCDAASTLLQRHGFAPPQAHATVIDRRASALLLSRDHAGLDALIASLPTYYSSHSKLWASTYSTYLVSLLSRGKLNRCVRAAIQACARLGIELPLRADKEAGVDAIYAAKRLLNEDPKKLDSVVPLAAQLLSLAIPAFHQARPDLYPFAAAAIIEASFGDPPADTLSFGIGTLGIACSLVGQTQEGYELGRRAIEVANEPFSERIAPRTKFAVSFLLEHHIDGVSSEMIDGLNRTYREATRQGDADHACYARHLEDVYKFHSSQPLSEVRQSLSAGSKIIDFYGQLHILRWNQVYEQLVENLVVVDRPPLLMHGSVFTEFAANSDSPQLRFRIHLARLILATIFCEYEVASSEADLLKLLVQAAGSQFESTAYSFFAALANYCAARRTDDSANHTRCLHTGDEFLAVYRQQVRLRQESPKASLGILEGARLLALGEFTAANDRLNQAASEAESRGNHLESALSLENLAVADRALQVESLAFRRARRTYDAWGAHNKVAQLDAMFGQAKTQEIHSESGNVSESEQDARLVQRLIVSHRCADAIGLFSLWLQQVTHCNAVHIESRGIWDAIASNDMDEFIDPIPNSISREVARTEILLDAPDIEQHGRISGDPAVIERNIKAFLAIGLRQAQQLVGIVCCTWNAPRARLPMNILLRIERMSKVFARLVETQLLATAMESQIRSHEDALTRATANLNAAHAKVRQFERTSWAGLIVGGLSHELSTPLASARLVTDSLASVTNHLLLQLEQGGSPTSEAASLAEGLGLIKSNLQTIGERVRNASQKVVESDILEKKTVLLKELVENVLEDIRFADPQRNRETVSVAIPSSLEIETYQDLLRQVLENVCNNGFQHGRSDSSSGVLTIDAEQTDELIRIRIRDNGPGFSSQNMFDPFESAASKESKDLSLTGGLGLGLSIAKSIVTGPLSGAIRARNADNGGAIVTIDLPRVVPDVAAFHSYSSFGED